MNSRYLKMLRFTVYIISFLLLASCVGVPEKEPQKEELKKPEVLNIDADVEEKFKLALSRIKSGEYDQAISLLEQLIAEEKRLPAPFVNLGIAYEKKGDNKQAEKYFLEALNIDLAHPVANNQLGVLYRKQGRFSEARKAYTNALTKHPDYLPVIRNLGILCEIYLRDLPCALQQYEHYLDLQPDDKNMKIWVADLSRRLK